MDNNKVDKTEEQWKTDLTPEQYHILREKGTETPFSGKYVDTEDDGIYRCAACGNQLFSSETKFHSGSGWPSFDQAIAGSIEMHEDHSYGMNRIEVTCARCGSHLGHLFEDGPAQTTGKRFCINSACLLLDQKNK